MHTLEQAFRAILCCLSHG